SLIVFILMHRIPGSPFEPASASRSLSEEQIKIIQKHYGLDKPGWQQYLIYLKNAVKFDFGESYVRRGQQVRSIIARDFKVSLKLGLVAVAVAVIGGFVFGVIAASRQNSPVDYALTFLSTLGIAFPNFILGVFLVWLFVLELGWI